MLQTLTLVVNCVCSSLNLVSKALRSNILTINFQLQFTQFKKKNMSPLLFLSCCRLLSSTFEIFLIHLLLHSYFQPGKVKNMFHLVRFVNICLIQLFSKVCFIYIFFTENNFGTSYEKMFIYNGKADHLDTIVIDKSFLFC